MEQDASNMLVMYSISSKYYELYQICFQELFFSFNTLL